MTIVPLVLLLQIGTPMHSMAAPAPVTAPAQPATPPAPRDATATLPPARPATTEDCHCGVASSPRGPR
jgi:hypothetical protein